MKNHVFYSAFGRTRILRKHRCVPLIGFGPQQQIMKKTHVVRSSFFDSDPGLLVLEGAADRGFHKRGPMFSFS